MNLWCSQNWLPGCSGANVAPSCVLGPSSLLRSTIWEGLEITGMRPFPAYYVLNGLLSTLQVLNLLWFVMIANMVCDKLRQGQVMKACPTALCRFNFLVDHLYRAPGQLLILRLAGYDLHPSCFRGLWLGFGFYIRPWKGSGFGREEGCSFTPFLFSSRCRICAKPDFIPTVSLSLTFCSRYRLAFVDWPLEPFFIAVVLPTSSLHCFDVSITYNATFLSFFPEVLFLWWF